MKLTQQPDRDEFNLKKKKKENLLTLQHSTKLSFQKDPTGVIAGGQIP